MCSANYMSPFAFWQVSNRSSMIRWMEIHYQGRSLGKYVSGCNLCFNGCEEEKVQLPYIRQPYFVTRAYGLALDAEKRVSFA